MRETQYIGKLKKKFYERHPDGFFYKIPDAHDGQQRPYDGYFVIKGKPTAFFEAKITNKLSPWSFGLIAPHQIKNLRIMLALDKPAFIVLGVRALTKKFDRKRLPRELSQVYADIWIPAQLIPGEGEEIGVKSLDVRMLVASLGDSLHGSKVNEIHLHEERFARFTEVA